MHQSKVTKTLMRNSSIWQIREVYFEKELKRKNIIRNDNTLNKHKHAPSVPSIKLPILSPLVTNTHPFSIPNKAQRISRLLKPPNFYTLNSIFTLSFFFFFKKTIIKNYLNLSR